MKILLLNEHIKGAVSEEETFWTVLEKALNAETLALSSFSGNLNQYLEKSAPDILIYNSILGSIKTPKKTKKIVFLQDNYKAMKELLPFEIREIVKRIIGKETYEMKAKKQEEALKTADIVVANSKNVASWYDVKNVRIIPVGTDNKLFVPLQNKDELKKKHGIPLNREIKIFVGSSHLVKGFDILKREIKKDEESFYILVLKDKRIPCLKFKNGKIFQRISQAILVELLNCADIYVGRSRVETLWLAPVEAMFCNIPVDVTSVGIFADWKPENKNPREEALKKGLDKETMIKNWQELVINLKSQISNLKNTI